MDYEIIDQQGVVTFTIRREAKRNAINSEVMNGLREAIDYVKKEQNSKIFVITGSGDKSFCSGGDLSEFHSLRTEDEAYEMLSKMGAILYDLATLEIPTIALVNGTAVGGGCEIATACDFRLVSENAKVGFIQGTLAITSGWGGGTYLFEKGLKHDDALKMLMDAKPLNAVELQSIGWASHVFVEDKSQALTDYIRNLTVIHPDVHKAYKKILLRKWNETNLYDRVFEEIRTCAVLWERDAHHEAVASFLNKSK